MLIRKKYIHQQWKVWCRACHWVVVNRGLKLGSRYKMIMGFDVEKEDLDSETFFDRSMKDRFLNHWIYNYQHFVNEASYNTVKQREFPGIRLRADIIVDMALHPRSFTDHCAVGKNFKVKIVSQDFFYYLIFIYPFNCIIAFHIM